MARTSPNGWLKLAGVILSIIGLTTGLVVWAATEDSRIKDFAVEQDRFRQQAVIEMTKEYYVPRSDFVRVETMLESQNDDMKEIQGELDELKKTTEKIYKSLSSRKR
jgi:hypothetical protein